MRDIKQIRESYLVLEKEDAEQKKLTTLVRAGLFDAKKLPILKRALKKDVTNMTSAEKTLLVDLLDSLMAQVLHSQQIYMKVRSNVSKKDMEDLKEAADYLTKFDPRIKPGYNERTDRQIPAVLILKRKAIRVYPDNQKVALYYAQGLDQYITIPFGLEDTSGPARIREDVQQLDELSPETLQSYAEKRANQVVNTSMSNAEIDRVLRAKKSGTGFKGGNYIARAVNKRAKKLGLPKQKFDLQALAQKGKERVGIEKVQAEKEAAAKEKAAKDLKKAANKPIKRSVSGGWEGIGNLIGHAAVDTGRGAARLVGVPKAKLRFEEQTNVKSRFKNKVKEKREEQLDEALPLLAVGALAARAAPLIARGASAAKKGYDSYKASRAITKARYARQAARKAKGAAAGAAAGAAIGSSIGGGDSSNKSDAAETRRSLSGADALEGLKGRYDFKGGLAGGNVSAPGTRDTISSTSQGDFRSPVDQIKYLNAMSKPTMRENVITFGEETVSINSSTTQKILDVYNTLNEENKQKFENMLNENMSSFKKAVNFALRY